MDQATARRIVVLSAVATAGIVTAGRLTKVRSPEPAIYLGLGFAYLVIAGITDVAPEVGAPLAGIVAVSTGVVYGPDAVAAFQKTLREGPSAAPAPRANPIAGAAGGVDTVTGLVDSPPLLLPFTIGGGPGEGTHSRTEGGNVWQDDNAVDLNTPFGNPVLAVADGTIVRTGGRPGTTGRYAGFKFTLDTGSNQFFYTHLSKLNVRDGQKVTAGTICGLSGSANGTPHLHFAVMNGNPIAFLH